MRAHYSQPLYQHCVRHMTTSDNLNTEECDSWFKLHTSDPLPRDSCLTVFLLFIQFINLLLLMLDLEPLPHQSNQLKEM